MATSLPTTIQPIIGMSRSYKGRIIDNDFGNGYTQRITDGINALQREIGLSWIGSITNIKELTDHFEEREYGTKSFTWTPPNETISRKWTCNEWSISNNSDDIQTLTANFVMRYDL
ncbi:MAG: phage tail protein [Methanogenium sp.]|jgi:phage-related protein